MKPKIYLFFFKKEAVPKKKHAWKFKNKIILGLQENQSLNISFTVFHVDQLCFDFLVLNIPVPIRKIIWGILVTIKAYLDYLHKNVLLENVDFQRWRSANVPVLMKFLTLMQLFLQKTA